MLGLGHKWQVPLGLPVQPWVSYQLPEPQFPSVKWRIITRILTKIMDMNAQHRTRKNRYLAPLINVYYDNY